MKYDPRPLFHLFPIAVSKCVPERTHRLGLTLILLFDALEYSDLQQDPATKVL